MADQLARLYRGFFDRTRVARFLDQKTRRVLSKFGRFTQRAAQTSMRPGGSYPQKANPNQKAKRGRRATFRTSRPGEPPRTHNTRLVRRMLFFSFDASKKTVVIGPVRLARTMNKHVPRSLEVGGLISLKKKDGTTKIARYAERPFMRPAFRKNLGMVASEYAK